MMGTQTFRPFDDGTQSLAVTNASGRINFTRKHNGSTVRVTNVGSALIFIKFGGADVTANTDDIPIPGNWVEVFMVPNEATHCAAISGTGGNTIYITPGDGD